MKKIFEGTSIIITEKVVLTEKVTLKDDLGIEKFENIDEWWYEKIEGICKKLYLDPKAKPGHGGN